MTAFLYEFEWEPLKAQANFSIAHEFGSFGKTANKGGNSRLRGTNMNPEYDFSKGERGKFFRPNAELRSPIHLNADVQTYLAERAAQKGVPLREMVNTLLKREIQMIESVK